MTKILINCPGSWTDGLDSPGRGESRWAQNLAYVLGKQPEFNVVACSAGNPQVGKGRPLGRVVLTTERQAKDHGPFDVYIDTAWWEGKKPVANARVYFRNHWSLEHFLRVPLPKNQCIMYPYYVSSETFINEFNPNKDRTFFQPTSFCEEFDTPAFDRKGFLWPCRPSDVFIPGRESYENGKTICSLIKDYQSLNNEPIIAHWLFGNDVSNEVAMGVKSGSVNRLHSLLPYCEVVKIMQKVKLLCPVNLPSCIPDAMAEGVAPLIWKTGGWPFLTEVAEKNNVLIPSSPSPQQISEVFNKLLVDKEVYVSYVRDLQYVFRHHKESEVVRIFKETLTKVL